MLHKLENYIYMDILQPGYNYNNNNNPGLIQNI